MKKAIDKCTIEYWACLLHSHGDPITVGKVTDVLCIKQDRFNNDLGIEIDYEADYLSDEANCWVRGLVTLPNLS